MFVIRCGQFNEDKDARRCFAENSSACRGVVVIDLIIACPEMVDVLLPLADPLVRQCVAMNTGTSAEVLLRLSGDEVRGVRRCVAKNPSAPTEVLLLLSGDEDEYVRQCVAGNPRTPAEALFLLMKDEDIYVRRFAAALKSSVHRCMKCHSTCCQGAC